jgi:hypothetical protein
MNVVYVNADLIEIDGKVRVERGPKTIVAVASEELLSDAVTASHYQVGRPDVMGKPIVIGEEMTYHDWLGFHGGGGVFYLYLLFNDVWQKAEQSFALQAAAVAEGVTLLNSEGAK